MKEFIQKITTTLGIMSGAKEHNVLKANVRITELSSLLTDANKAIVDMSKELEDVKQQNACIPEMAQNHKALLDAKDAEMKALTEAHAQVVAELTAKVDAKSKTDTDIENDIQMKSNLETAAKLAALGVPSNKIPELVTMTPEENESYIWSTFRGMTDKKQKQEFYNKHSMILGKQSVDVFSK